MYKVVLSWWVELYWPFSGLVAVFDTHVDLSTAYIQSPGVAVPAYLEKAGYKLGN